MTRSLATASLSLAALLAACTASSDTAGEGDPAAHVQDAFVCPNTMTLDLADYGDEALPQTDDFILWHSEMGERDGVETTDSGLQYRVVQPGLENGVSPNPGNEIFAHYHGAFPNAEVFDSSYERGSPLIGPSNRFIRGWNEALADMTVCEARTLYVPADLAYGDNPRGGRPAGTLVFHMQLLRVNR